jgi:cation diffusion facilitator family transporter
MAGMLTSRDRRKGTFVLRFGIFGNILLFALKLSIGLISRSVALVNDAFNSLSDVFASILALLGYRTSQAPLDRDHHYGHRKAEPLCALGVALLIVLMGAFLAYSTIGRLGSTETPGGLALWVAAFSILLKEILARYSLKIGNRLKSPTIRALAVDHRSDELSSFLAFIGILGAKLGIPVLDPLAGLIIALIIVLVGLRVGKRNVDMLMDKAPDPRSLEIIRTCALSVEGVLGVHRVRARQLGEEVSLDLHVEVDSNLSIREAHEIAHRVQDCLESLDDVASALVHVCPKGESGEQRF